MSGESKENIPPQNELQKKHQNYIDSAQLLYGNFFEEMRKSSNNITAAQAALADIDKALEENLEALKKRSANPPDHNLNF